MRGTHAFLRLASLLTISLISLAAAQAAKQVSCSGQLRFREGGGSVTLYKADVTGTVGDVPADDTLRVRVLDQANRQIFSTSLAGYRDESRDDYYWQRVLSWSEYLSDTPRFEVGLNLDLALSRMSLRLQRVSRSEDTNLGFINARCQSFAATSPKAR